MEKTTLGGYIWEDAVCSVAIAISYSKKIVLGWSCN
jgi:hypothetical protein